MSTAKNISTKSSTTKDPMRVLLAAGGTGGHVYPAISIADAILKTEPDAEILFVGTRDRMEWKTVPKAGYEIKSVWISGFHRRLTPQNLLFPIKLATSLIQSYSILRQFKPDIIVACGGFAAGPIGWVAQKTGIPIVLQEQNSYPGVTNRLLAKKADKIFTAFEAAEEFFPAKKITLTGNPVRSELELTNKADAAKAFDFDGGKPVLLILGGSGGARAINQVIKKNIDRLHDELGVQIIWQCGQRYYDDLSDFIKPKNYKNLRLMEFIDDMSTAYSAADLVLTRAGASTCSELMMIGKPAVLVPSPNVAGDHQTKNAEAMAKNDASVLLPESELDKSMVNLLSDLLFDQEKLFAMGRLTKALAKPDAAATIAKEIFKIAKNR
ncbi:MAG: undecaprenyldiphospho-muramoylpentapeptide beta-N-acetylglucosaminyltransferase [Balneolaceae bacterium]